LGTKGGINWYIAWWNLEYFYSPFYRTWIHYTWTRWFDHLWQCNSKSSSLV